MEELMNNDIFDFRNLFNQKNISTKHAETRSDIFKQIEDTKESSSLKKEEDFQSIRKTYSEKKNENNQRLKKADLLKFIQQEIDYDFDDEPDFLNQSDKIDYDAGCTNKEEEYDAGCTNKEEEYFNSLLSEESNFHPKQVEKRINKKVKKTIIFPEKTIIDKSLLETFFINSIKDPELSYNKLEEIKSDDLKEDIKNELSNIAKCLYRILFDLNSTLKIWGKGLLELDDQSSLAFEVLDTGILKSISSKESFLHYEKTNPNQFYTKENELHNLFSILDSLKSSLNLELKTQAKNYTPQLNLEKIIVYKNLLTKYGKIPTDDKGFS